MLKELFGHRGAAGEAPENTITGFEYAWRVGVRSFELDIRLSADGQLVLLHDESLLRTAGIDRKVWEMSSTELAEIETHSKHPDWVFKTGIPRLQDVLERFSKNVHSWELEIKSDEEVRLEAVSKALVEMIDTFAIQNKVVVTSFDPRALLMISRLNPDLRKGFISRFDRVEDLKTAEALGCYRTCIPLKTSNKETVKVAHAMGFNVTGWLGDTEKMIRTLLDWDVDAITTNQPSLALDYLSRQKITLPGQQ